MNQITRFHFILPIGLALLSGCGDPGLEKVVVTGKVSYQGKPVQDGMLRFVPIEGTKGPVSGAIIKDGTYTAKAIGGVPLGKLRVEIRGFRKHDGVPQGEGPDVAVRPGGREQYLPKKYNHQSELTVTIDSTGQQTRDFELQ
ncbi:MAG: hypothetical protein GXP26_04685 [Planctomycetes bacterium]|nr:hypothetical protein [Planctomycetota bacterium]